MVKSRTPNEPKVSILKQGNFGLNAAVAKLFKERQVEYVVLMFDAETNRIAFKPAKKEEQGAYQLRGQKGALQISGLAFLKNYNIPHKEGTKSYPASWSDELGMLIVQL
jgi:hypothetical protein